MRLSPLALLPATAFGLGTWQVFRWQQKKEALAFREERRVAQPVALPSPSDMDVDSLEFRRVTAQGHYQHDKEMQSGPRSHDGASGRYIITPFCVSSGDAGKEISCVLVNRGWVPRDVVSWRRPEGTVKLTGVVRKSEKRRMFVPENGGGVWFFLDHQQMGEKSGCVSYPHIRLDAIENGEESTKKSSFSAADDEFPKGGTTVYWMPNNHVQYIFTWYGLSAALVGIMALAKKGKMK